MKLRPTDKVAVFGRTGSGKTTLSKGLQQQFPRVIVIDPMNEYERPGDTDVIVQGVPGLLDLLKRIRVAGARNFHITVQFRPGSDDLAEFEKICRLVYAFGDVVLVVEELWAFMKGEWMPLPFRDLVFRGRHRGIGILATAQRPARVSKDFVSQCSHVFASHTFEKNELRYFSETLGERAAEALGKLGAYEFLHWKPDGFLKNVKNRAS